jgi:tetratricopeptide (TPR) repeat protein
MTLPRVASAVAALLLTYLPGAAGAQKGIDRDVCSRGKPQAAIASCTYIINSKEPDDVRAMALRNRGSLFQSNGDLDRAIEDYTSVLKLSPSETKMNAKT